MTARLPLWLLGLCLAACGGSTGMSGPTMSGSVNDEPAGEDLTRHDILAREPVTDVAKVKHVLIAWRDLEDEYGGRLDERAKRRSRQEADALARRIFEEARAGTPIEKLMLDHSEDPGSARNAAAYEVTPDEPLAPEFKRMSLRLEVGEVGLVRTRFGWHIIKRVK